MNQKVKSEETQKMLMESAFSLFYKNGYRTTSIFDIVKHTGLSKGAFYHHFKNKQDIGEKTIQYILRSRVYNAMIHPLKEKSTQTATTFLTNLFTRRINEFTEEENRLGCPLNNLINEVGYNKDILRVSLKNIIEEWKHTLTLFLEEGIKKGEIRQEVVPSPTATYLISAFEGVRGINKLYDNDGMLKDYLSAIVIYIQNLK